MTTRKFLGFICLICIIIWDHAEAAKKSKDGLQWTEQLAGVVNKYMADPNKITDELKKLVKPLAQQFMRSPTAGKGSEGPKTKVNQRPVEERVCQPSNIAACAADLLSFIDDFFEERYPLRYKRLTSLTCGLDECPASPRTERSGREPKGKAADNIFGLFGEFQQLYEDVKNGLQMNVDRVSGLIFRFLDYMVDNPGVDSLFLTLLDSLGTDRVVRSLTKNALSWILDGYRTLRGSGNVVQMFNELRNHLSLDKLTDKDYLKSLAMSKLPQFKFNQYQNLVNSAIDLVTVSFSHLRDVDVKEIVSKGSVTDQLEYVQGLVVVYPWNEIASLFAKYKSLINTFNHLKTVLPTLIEEQGGSSGRLEALERKIPQLVKSFELIEREINQKRTKFGPKFINQMAPTAKALTELLKEMDRGSQLIDEDLERSSEVSAKEDMRQFARRVKAELKRWKVVQRAVEDVKKMKHFDEQLIWKNFRDFIEDIPRFKSLISAFDSLAAEIIRILQNNHGFRF